MSLNLDKAIAALFRCELIPEHELKDLIEKVFLRPEHALFNHRLFLGSGTVKPRRKYCYC